MKIIGEPKACGCCGGSPAPAPEAACPACGQAGKPVQPSTLKALLEASARADVDEGPWRFCGTPTCDLVYFNPVTGRTFRKDRLTVRVGLKEAEAPRPLCYCFDHSFESLRTEWEATGRLASVEAIRTAVKEGRCRCDTLNPSGACCLGDVLKAAQAIQAASPSR